LFSLADIVSETQEQSLILKIDCEGCENDVILSSSKETLQHFTHMQIEYHYGYQNLKEKLETCGFNVDVTRPKISRKLKENSKAYVGFLLAKRKES